MKKEVLKSFSCFGCDCSLELVSFEHSNQTIYQVSVYYCVTPKDWNFNYQVVTFGDNEHDAKQCFSEFIKDFI